MSSVVEENLREAVSIGNIEIVNLLLSQKVNINSQNNINGWTALHWAYKRGNDHLIKLLISQGANPNIKNFKGQTPKELSSLNNSADVNKNSSDHELTCIPNYLKNPTLSFDVQTNIKKEKTTDSEAEQIRVRSPIEGPSLKDEEVLVLKVKIECDDPDYIEIEVPTSDLTYVNLLKRCCQELEISESDVERIRKRPCVRLRNDKDVKRLREWDLLEIVLKPHLCRI